MAKSMHNNGNPCNCTEGIYSDPKCPEVIAKLLEENKRLKLLAHDLQKEIEVKVLESQETHELEEK